MIIISPNSTTKDFLNAIAIRLSNLECKKAKPLKLEINGCELALSDIIMDYYEKDQSIVAICSYQVIIIFFQSNNATNDIEVRLTIFFSNLNELIFSLLLFFLLH